MKTSRRKLLEGTAAALATTALSKPTLAQAFSFTPNQRYPDPAIEILDPSFAKYRIVQATVERIVLKLLAKHPDDRYPKAQTLLEDLIDIAAKTRPTGEIKVPSGYLRDSKSAPVAAEKKWWKWWGVK